MYLLHRDIVSICNKSLSHRSAHAKVQVLKAGIENGLQKQTPNRIFIVIDLKVPQYAGITQLIVLW